MNGMPRLILFAALAANGPANYRLGVHVVDEYGSPYERCMVELRDAPGGKLLSRDWMFANPQNSGLFFVTGACLIEQEHAIGVSCLGSEEQRVVDAGSCDRAGDDLSDVDLGLVTLRRRPAR